MDIVILPVLDMIRFVKLPVHLYKKNSCLQNVDYRMWIVL